MNVARRANAIGAWLSAALDDPTSCEEFKADIHAWFNAGEPAPHCSSVQAAVLAYDAALHACANDPKVMSSFCTVRGDTLDTLYEEMITAARAATC